MYNGWKLLVQFGPNKNNPAMFEQTCYVSESKQKSIEGRRDFEETIKNVKEQLQDDSVKYITVNNHVVFPKENFVTIALTAIHPKN